MPADIQNAVLQHALDVGHTYKANAHLDRGIPDRPERIVVGAQSATDRGTVQPSPEPAPVSKSSRWPLLLASVLSAALGATGIAGAGGLAYWLLAPSPPAPASSPVEPAEQQDPSGSLLQYLEDHGYHVPEGQP